MSNFIWVNNSNIFMNVIYVIVSSMQVACNKTLHSISLKKFLNLNDIASCIE